MLCGLVRRELEYKYVVGDSDGELVEWYPGENLTTVVAANETVEVSDEWVEDALIESDEPSTEVAEAEVDGADDAPVAEVDAYVSGTESQNPEATDGAQPEAQAMETSILDTEEPSEPNGSAPEASARNGSHDASEEDETEAPSKSGDNMQVEFMS